MLLIAALLRGGFRQFPAVFAYVVAEFLSSVIEMPLALTYYHTHNVRVGSRYVFWYWLDETILQLIVLIVVMSLIWQVTRAAHTRRMVRTGLSLGMLLFAGISFAVHFDSKLPAGIWMTLWARDINFASAILDMALWAMLIARRPKDGRVLALSGGLGIMFTGEAIGESLRSLSPRLVFQGDIFMIVTYLVFLYIWWQAFRTARPLGPN